MLLIQLGVFLGYSVFLYRRFDLGVDFAAYNQAWSLIGRGHLNPIDTIHAPAFPFWQNHFELALWPIALVGAVWPHPIQLLFLQDIAIVATELIVVHWVSILCVERRVPARNTVATIAALILFINAWWYETASFDIHFETLGLPFVVWAGYSMWNGRFRRAVILALIAMLFGDVVVVSIVLVALTCLTSRRVRDSGGVHPALALLGIGIVWLAIATILHANQGDGLVSNYGYLVHAGPKATGASVMWSMLGHPSTALHVLSDRGHAIVRVMTSVGVIGIFTPWGFFAAIGLLPAALNVNPAFVSRSPPFRPWLRWCSSTSGVPWCCSD